MQKVSGPQVFLLFFLKHLYYTETSSDTDLFSLPSQWSLQTIRVVGVHFEF